MTANIVGIIQARMGSTRLPKKVLKPLIEGRSALSLMLDRIKRTKHINTIVIATTTLKEDDAIEAECERLHIPCYRGNSDDVLLRYYNAAEQHKADIVVRLTADCPLIDPKIVDEVIELYQRTGCDYASNALIPSYPDGLDTEVFSVALLNWMHQHASKQSDREHVTPYVHRHRNHWQLETLRAPQDYSHLRWTLDEPEDLALIKKIYASLYPTTPQFGMQDILSLLEKQPELNEINAHIHRNEGYQRSVEEEKLVYMNHYGFYSVINPPTEKDLERYYQKTYYQKSKGNYRSVYSTEELLYFRNKIQQKEQLIYPLLKTKKKPRLLDVGCGEGFVLDFFKKKKWSVQGIDYSDAGLKKHNPHCEREIQTGNIVDSLQTMIIDKQSFDVIWLSHVLEHVRNPLALLKKLAKVAPKTGILVCIVPNDFSKLQMRLLESKHISSPFWVSTPDRLSYFNASGLTKLACEGGWTKHKILADFPVDFNLFNPNANYVVLPETGKGAHSQRINIENLLHDISIDKTNALYEALANLGLGREIIGIFRKK